jgi:hypothetical protein
VINGSGALLNDHGQRAANVRQRADERHSVSPFALLSIPRKKQPEESSVLMEQLITGWRSVGTGEDGWMRRLHRWVYLLSFVLGQSRTRLRSLKNSNLDHAGQCRALLVSIAKAKRVHYDVWLCSSLHAEVYRRKRASSCSFWRLSPNPYLVPGTCTSSLCYCNTHFFTLPYTLNVLARAGIRGPACEIRVPNSPFRRTDDRQSYCCDVGEIQSHWGSKPMT